VPKADGARSASAGGGGAGSPSPCRPASRPPQDRPARGPSTHRGPDTTRTGRASTRVRPRVGKDTSGACPRRAALQAGRVPGTPACCELARESLLVALSRGRTSRRVTTRRSSASSYRAALQSTDSSVHACNIPQVFCSLLPPGCPPRDSPHDCAAMYRSPSAAETFPPHGSSTCRSDAAAATMGPCESAGPTGRYARHR
jgi:hypothetical protein